MKMKLSKRARELTPSLTRRLFDLAKNYSDVIDLTLGDPDILPPREIRNAACRAIQLGRTRYSQNAGLREAREVVAAFNSRFYGKSISSDEVILTCGGMEAIYLMLASLVEAGDEVIIPGPYWINYEQMVRLCGGTPVIVPTKEADNFAVTAESLSAAITKKSKVLIVNSPCNPSGRTITRKVLGQIARLVKEHDLFVISDEVYRSLIYDNKRHESIWTHPGMQQRCAIIDSMSKRFSMTGYRLGMAIAPKELITAMTRFQENVAACAPLPSQYAAIAGYGNEIDTSYLLREFTIRRNAILNGFSDMPRMSLSGIDGTFYAFVNISQTGLNSYDFAMRLLEQQHVAVVPGRTYGQNYDDFIRIAFTLKVPLLKQAMNRIKKFTESL